MRPMGGIDGPDVSDKFRKLWANDPAVLKFLGDHPVMKVGNGKGIDPDWFDTRNRPSVLRRVTADLAIACVIRTT